MPQNLGSAALTENKTKIKKKICPYLRKYFILKEQLSGKTSIETNLYIIHIN
jgi:hypothetical protein